MLSTDARATAIVVIGPRQIGNELQYGKNKFLSRATAIAAIGPRQIGKPNQDRRNRAVICQKLISVEGDGHCCHRPSSNWETNQPGQVINKSRCIEVSICTVYRKLSHSLISR